MSNSDQIARVQGKLQQLRQAGVRYTHFSSRIEKFAYELMPSLTASEIGEFERRHSVVLPSGYREFLLSVGNGGAGPYHGLYPLDISYQEHLTKPFPLTDELIFFKYCSQGESFVEWTYKREEPAYRKYVEERIEQLHSPLYEQGTVPMAHYGCGIFFLLILNGPEHGNIWVRDLTNEDGFFPLRTSKADERRVGFLNWYEIWLDHNLREMSEEHKIADYAFWHDYGWIDEWVNHTSAPNSTG